MKIRRRPENGTTRTIRRFAWMPVYMRNAQYVYGDRIWLERYSVQQKFCRFKIGYGWSDLVLSREEGRT